MEAPEMMLGNSQAVREILRAMKGALGMPLGASHPGTQMLPQPQNLLPLLLRQVSNLLRPL